MSLLKLIGSGEKNSAKEANLIPIPFSRLEVPATAGGRDSVSPRAMARPASRPCVCIMRTADQSAQHPREGDSLSHSTAFVRRHSDY